MRIKIYYVSCITNREFIEPIILPIDAIVTKIKIEDKEVPIP